MRRADRARVLRMVPADLTTWLDTLNALAADGAVCIVGHEKAVQASGEEGLNVVSLG
jgi:hypothetical protein